MMRGCIHQILATKSIVINGVDPLPDTRQNLQCALKRASQDPFSGNVASSREYCAGEGLSPSCTVGAHSGP
jgi:hypothetical protein